MPAPPSLHHLVYISDATHSLSVSELEALLHQSRAYNQAHELTGILFYSEGLPGTSSPGSFFQILEGNEFLLRELLARVRFDPRNTNLQVLIDGPTPQRLFSDWSMGFTAIIPPDMETLVNYVNPHESRFSLPRARAISSSLQQFIQLLLTEYPAWPYPAP